MKVKASKADLVQVVGRREAGKHLYVVGSVSEDDFTGVHHFGLHPLTPRLYVGRPDAPRAQLQLTQDEILMLPSPASALEQAENGPDAWPTRTRRTLERAFVLWLLHEDSRHLLDATEVDQLAHQKSLLEYVQAQDLKRLMIADEVGLGKTVEAGLVIQWVLRSRPSARVLYLAPAMLVDNVHRELKRLNLGLRIDRYASTSSTVDDETLGDAQLIVASIHRVCTKNNAPKWRERSGTWDLVIVDECHHLSDWSVEGNDPQQQMKVVRQLLTERLSADGRVVLMSATPHQGNENRFRNLLRLLTDDHRGPGDLKSVTGRIIYRTKEDVVDWDGKPLFSKRQVNPPTYVELSPEYHAWLGVIAAVFEGAAKGPAAWRKAQALQWCASSPKAGLAYLARVALRCDETFKQAPLASDVATALLPYRRIPVGASPETVLDALLKHIGRPAGEQDDEEVEDELGDSGAEINFIQLEKALRLGVQMVRSGAMQTKMQPLVDWVQQEAPSKFVVFASPVETVDDLKVGLERILGDDAVVTVTGSQKPGERLAAMRRFSDSGVRALVASRAGSEGINLQVSHRLVHFDVPWNPMEMEQRVGRVHRYGSTRTVVVDTIVAKGSREERMLERCRARLAQIVEQLFGPESKEKSRFGEMYGRVMSQVSAEELTELMVSEGFQSDSDERIDELVRAGFEGWQTTDKALRQASKQPAGVPNQGVARDHDLDSILELSGAEQEDGWRHVRLEEVGGDRREITVPARVWRLRGDGFEVRRVADRVRSLSLQGPNGFSGYLKRVGLNQAEICAVLRDVVGGADTGTGKRRPGTRFCDGAGAARLSPDEWAKWLSSAGLSEAYSTGAIVLAWSVRLLHRGTPEEAWTGTRWRLCSPDLTETAWLDRESQAELVRLLFASRSNQTLRHPPHQRVESEGFALQGLHEFSRQSIGEALRGEENFDASRHDYEIVPFLALTIEPRGDIVAEEDRSTRDAGESVEGVIEYVHAQLRPSAAFVERLALGVQMPAASRKTGGATVQGIVVAERRKLAALDSSEHERGFSVILSLDGEPTVREGEEIVGRLLLPDEFCGTSLEHAKEIVHSTSRELTRLGVPNWLR